MNDTKEMTISDELYKKYKIIQGECYSYLCNLGNLLDKKNKLLEQTKDNTEKVALIKRINNIKENIAMYQAKSSILREFLHEIALENVEDKENG
jgi:predicted CopG family antitoxin